MRAVRCVCSVRMLLTTTAYIGLRRVLMTGISSSPRGAHGACTHRAQLCSDSARLCRSARRRGSAAAGPRGHSAGRTGGERLGQHGGLLLELLAPPQRGIQVRHHPLGATHAPALFDHRTVYWRAIPGGGEGARARRAGGLDRGRVLRTTGLGTDTRCGLKTHTAEVEMPVVSGGVQDGAWCVRARHLSVAWPAPRRLPQVPGARRRRAAAARVPGAVTHIWDEHAAQLLVEIANAYDALTGTGNGPRDVARNAYWTQVRISACFTPGGPTSDALHDALAARRENATRQLLRVGRRITR